MLYVSQERYQKHILLGEKNEAIEQWAMDPTICVKVIGERIESFFAIA